MRIRDFNQTSPYLILPVICGAIPLAFLAFLGCGKSLPGWYEGAWQVTGVLIGFGLTVFIFLMDFSVAKTFRSVAAFKAVIRSAGIEWPLGLGLSFIAYVAIALRWEDPNGTPLPAAANSFALLFFVVQVLWLGVVFRNGFGLMPAGSIQALISKTFRSEALRDIQAELVKRHGTQLLANACEEVSPDGPRSSITSGTFLRDGDAVQPKKSGIVVDVDLDLPKTLAALVGSGRIYLAQPGDSVGPDSPVAYLDDVEKAVPVEKAIRRGTRTSNNVYEPGTHNVYREAIDFARKAETSKSLGDLDTAIAIIVGGFTEVALAWQAFGHEYEGAIVGAPLNLSLEDQMFADLRDLADTFSQSEDPHFVDAISRLSHDLMRAGETHDAPLLFQQGLLLSVAQVQLLR